MEQSALYRMVWRWHFYAGLFVLPFIVILSVTGALYLFKPQIERWEERAFHGLPVTEAVLPSTQVAAALQQFPGAHLHSYRLPERPGDAAMVHLALEDGRTMRDVFVSPEGRVLGSMDPEQRIMAIDHRIHGQLLLGPRGSWLVELAASWAMVMVLSGLYLWWPSGRGLAGVLWPRILAGNRTAWRDLHAVTGFWISIFVLILLLTGLPWAGVWGTALKTVRAEMGWTTGSQDWTIGGKAEHRDHMEHGDHDHAAMHHGEATSNNMDVFDGIVDKAAAANLAFPVLVTPPGKARRFSGGPSQTWTVQSEAQNRPLRTVIKYDPSSMTEVSRQTFADKHIIDRVIGYGIAWHEGHLFGWINQLIGVLTAVGLITMSVSGFMMWRKRKPVGLGAPPMPPVPARVRGIVILVVALAAVLPMLAISLIFLLIFDRAVLPHMPRTAAWLGVTPRVQS